MTIQKAMRVRAELKKELGYLDDFIENFPNCISFKEKYPTEEEIINKRNEKHASFDGMNYEDVIKRYFTIINAILDLNIAIEKRNQEGHNLLFKETAIKSKLSLIDKQIESERSIKPEVETLDYDYENTDEKGNYKRIKVKNYNFSILDNNLFGMDLIAYRKHLVKELEIVRDELSAFNATKKIDYNLPEGIL